MPCYQLVYRGILFTEFTLSPLRMTARLQRFCPHVEQPVIATVLTDNEIAVSVVPTEPIYMVHFGSVR